MATKCDMEATSSEEWSQFATADQLEKRIDHELADPFFRKPKNDTDPDIGFLIFRMPDATIISDDVAEELKRRYVAVGWSNVICRIGTTPETEYQIHVYLTYRK